MLKIPGLKQNMRMIFNNSLDSSNRERVLGFLQSWGRGRWQERGVATHLIYTGTLWQSLPHTANWLRDNLNDSFTYLNRVFRVRQKRINLHSRCWMLHIDSTVRHYFWRFCGGGCYHWVSFGGWYRTHWTHCHRSDCCWSQLGNLQKQSWGDGLWSWNFNQRT